MHRQCSKCFCARRLISDNVLLAYELLHTPRQKRMGKKSFMAIKLDMSKAYNRVEWGFIREIMLRMGFTKKWIDSLMNYMSTVSYQVVANGSIGKTFNPKRGLRQGDPLSPFLFLICGEGLSSLMRIASNKGVIKGVKASRSGPQVTHLLFADDCILLGEASRKGATTIREILKGV